MRTCPPRTEYGRPDATSHKITFSNCIIAEGLRNASHEKGKHSMGSLIMTFCRDIAVIGNLYAHNGARNPYFKATPRRHRQQRYLRSRLPGHPAELCRIEWKAPSTSPRIARKHCGQRYIQGTDTEKDTPMISSRRDAYMEDNLAFDRESGQPVVGGSIRVLKEKRSAGGLTPLPANLVLMHVAKNAGARPRIVTKLTGGSSAICWIGRAES